MIALKDLKQCAIAFKERLCYNSFTYKKIQRKNLLFGRPEPYAEEIE